MGKSYFDHTTTGVSMSCLIYDGTDPEKIWDGSDYVNIDTVEDADWATGAVVGEEKQTDDSTPTARYVFEIPEDLPDGPHLFRYFETATPAPAEQSVGYQRVYTVSATEVAAEAYLVALAAKFVGMTSLPNWLRAGLRTTGTDETTLNEINSGGGGFNPASQSNQGIGTAVGSLGGTVTVGAYAENQDPATLLKAATFDGVTFLSLMELLLASMAGETIVHRIQTITIQGSPTGGTFTLTYGGQTTGSLSYVVSAASLQTALEGLSTIGSGNVTVTGSNGGPWEVTLQGSLNMTQLYRLSSTASLSGGTNVMILHTTQVEHKKRDGTTTKLTLKYNGFDGARTDSTIV